MKNVLRETRELIGKKIADVASEIGVEVNTIYRWETGKLTPNLKYGPMIELAYGKRLQELFPEVFYG